jgi:hypothetical protein
MPDNGVQRSGASVGANDRADGTTDAATVGALSAATGEQRAGGAECHHHPLDRLAERPI